MVVVHTQIHDCGSISSKSSYGIYTVYIYIRGSSRVLCYYLISSVSLAPATALIRFLLSNSHAVTNGANFSHGLVKGPLSDRAISDSIGVPRSTVKDWRKSEFRYQQKRGSGRPLATINDRIEHLCENMDARRA